MMNDGGEEKYMEKKLALLCPSQIPHTLPLNVKLVC
jgi:hypothetical protein